MNINMGNEMAEILRVSETLNQQNKTKFNDEISMRTKYYKLINTVNYGRKKLDG